jgi:hypothetical protein
MKDRPPCISCKHRSPGCQSRCEIGKAFWKRQQERSETIRAAKEKENQANSVTIGQMIKQNGRGGLET